jgi:hypothetical protein
LFLKFPTFPTGLITTARRNKDSMLFDSTTILLRSIVTSVQSGGEIRWEDHLEFGNQCLYELHQMSHSTSRPIRADSNAKFPAGAPPFARAIRAIPHLKSMMRAIRHRDQSGAVEAGRAALAEMNGIKTAPSCPPPIESKPDSSLPVNPPEQPAKMVHRHKKPETKKRAAVTKRKPARVSAASSR